MPNRPPPQASALGVETRRLRITAKAQVVAVRIRELQATGLTLGQVAAALERAGVRGLRGGMWRPDAVRHCLELAGDIPAPEIRTPEPAPDADSVPWRSRTRII